MMMQKYNFSVNKSIIYRFSVQNRFLEEVAFVGEFKGEEGSFFVDEPEKYLVAFPHGQFEEAFFLDPFEVALVAHDLVASPVGTHEEVHVFAFPDIRDEGYDAAVAPLGDGKPSLFPHLAQHAVFGTLTFLEMAAHAKPFVVVQVIFFFGAVEHEVLVAAFKIA